MAPVFFSAYCYAVLGSAIQQAWPAVLGSPPQLVLCRFHHGRHHFARSPGDRRRSGAASASESAPTQSATNIMVVGIIFQLVTMGIFILLGVDFCLRAATGRSYAFRLRRLEKNASGPRRSGSRSPPERREPCGYRSRNPDSRPGFQPELDGRGKSTQDSQWHQADRARCAGGGSWRSGRHRIGHDLRSGYLPFHRARSGMDRLSHHPPDLPGQFHETNPTRDFTHYPQNVLDGIPMVIAVGHLQHHQPSLGPTQEGEVGVVLLDRRDPRVGEDNRGCVSHGSVYRFT